MVGAAQGGMLSVLTALIDAKADVNCVSKDGETPLSKAIQTDHEECVFLLLKNGANIQPARRMYPPYMVNAAGYGMLSVLTVLIDAKADVNCVCEDGHTPLIMVISQRREA
jgi:ankyrin repeat protein